MLRDALSETYSVPLFPPTRAQSPHLHYRQNKGIQRCPIRGRLQQEQSIISLENKFCVQGKDENFNPSSPFQQQRYPMKNVHFSPVVSQLRYPPVECPLIYNNRHIPSSIHTLEYPHNLSSPSSPIQKVTVQVQQIEKPLQQRVQRIQVSVPHQNGRGTERLSLDLCDFVQTERNECHSSLNSNQLVLFSNKICHENHQSFPSSRNSCQQQHHPNTGNSWKHPPPFTRVEVDSIEESHRTKTTAANSVGNGADTSASCLHSYESSCTTVANDNTTSICKLNKTPTCDYAMPDEMSADENVTIVQMHFSPLKLNDPENAIESSDVNNEKINNFENALINGSHASSTSVTRSVNVGSLEDFIEVEEKDKSTNQYQSGKNKGVSSSHSWPSAYRKLKEKSKPKLSFLHRITFGRFGGSSVTKDNSKSNKKSQKRSSCPPLGHPILLGSPTGIEDEGLINDLSSPASLSQALEDNALRSQEDLEINQKGFLNNQIPCNNYDNKNSNSRLSEEPDLTRKGNNVNLTSDLPPKPFPRQAHVKCLNSTASKSRLYQNERSDPDELSVKFERILEGILDLECDVMDGKEDISSKLNLYEQLVENDAPEDEVDRAFSVQNQKNGILTSRLEGETVVNSYNEAHYDNTSHAIPTDLSVEDKVTIPVFGKPPKPPSSANRHLGMRTGASERFSYLKGRMSATATTETRLAMELAAKLCEFREELHRSREEIAKSHPNLEEIENSVRISMAIDRSQRTLPQSRNYTKLSLPPVLLYHDGIGIASGESSCSAEEPVKPVTEIIREEWESVVSRAKQKFSRSSLQHNNGNSEPLESRGIVLETDLDTGASREFPVDDSFSYGDTSRRKDLEKVLKVEDFPSSLVQRNSCSLQNLSLVPIPDMATLTPGEPSGKEDRSRSMEFLVEDSDKNAHLRPPENTLMKNQETRRMSEHELRIQRSLQKLNVPDWYKNYAPTSSSAAGTPSKSRDFGSGTGLAGGWPGLSTSKTSSLTSLQSAGRYTGSRAGFGSARHRSTGTASTGGRSSRESLMSPSSTASASPSPYFERSSFTYGMPYALTRFAAARMSCGASPASLSPSPSPVGGIGSSTSTPVSSGPAARYGYQKQPYLGWRSQERLTSKTLYRSPAERLAADIIAQKAKPTTPVLDKPPPEIEVKTTSPKKETASSDLSLNNSEESNSHKLNRVRSSIKEVSNAIVDYVNESKPLDDGMNGRASPRRGLVWLESSFVGTKPIDSPGTPDTPSTFMSHRGSRKDTAFRFDEHAERTKDAELKSGESSSTSHYTSYISRNEQMEERSNSSSVSSPTLEDILDSLLALRRPNKKFRSRGKGHDTTSKPGSVGDSDVYITSTPTPTFEEHHRTQPRPQPIHQYQFEPSTTSEICSTTSSVKSRFYPEPSSSSSTSDWQDRMNQPLADSTFISGEPETFTLTGCRTGTGGASGGISPLASALISSSTISNNQQLLDKYSASSGYSTAGGVGVNESVGCSSSSSNPIHSTSSSLHSTPTHHQYHYQQQQHDQREQHNQSSSVVASSKDYSSSTMSCLDSTPRDDNELRQSLLRDEEELAFGNPTEIRSTVTSSTVAPITGGVIVNPLTGLSEYSNPPTPARNRRVSFDLDFSDKEEKSSSRSKNKDENVGGTIQCRNTKCGKTATGLEARREFKVCHNCNAYYCSRECRRAHWEKHKKVCMQSRVGAICKQIISHVKEDSYVMNQLSTVAKRGFLAKGRGCVKLFFNSPDRAERFLTGGLPELPEPLYIPHSDMLPEEMGAQTFSELSDQCRSYNSDTRFVLYACVCVVNEVPTYGAVKWERELISRSSKLRLLLPRNFYEEIQRQHHAPANPAHLMSALQDPSNGRTSPGLQPQQQNVPLYDSVTPSAHSTSGDEFPPPPLPPHQNPASTTATMENETLILRSVPPPSTHQLTSNEHKRLREVSFTNILKHLLQKGVDLKRMYPDIFMKLCRYVEHDEPFLPVTIYPKNSQTGRQFVCVIMPESSDSAYSSATVESGQTHPLQRVETINISEQDDEDIT